jgi:DNA/RNA endonuclease YhcR with UshA esterase domain
VVAPEAPEDPADIVKEAFELEVGDSLPYEATLTGEIISVDTAYSEQYGNITVTIKVGEKAIKCFRLKGEGANVITTGDVITVTGTLTNYNGEVQFKSGCTFAIEN